MLYKIFIFIFIHCYHKDIEFTRVKRYGGIEPQINDLQSKYKTIYNIPQIYLNICIYLNI
jgi:hypothetical protein